MTALMHTSEPPAEKNETSHPKPQEAVLAVGAVLELAHLVGPAPNLSDIPKRELSVEVVMNLASEILWPELGHEQPVEIDDIDANRAQEYSLLAMLLVRPPDAATLSRIAALQGDTTPLGLAHLTLARVAGNANAERIDREYFNLFIGVGRGELLPYGSYYLTGFLNERPLARLRDDLRAHHIERAEGHAEPEDHAAILCEIMSGMASGQFPITIQMQRRFFEKHLAPWIGRFFVDLERAEAADFYRDVGALGRLFVETEAQAFRL